jgi:P pilus assembly chaperone PapD
MSFKKLLRSLLAVLLVTFVMGWAAVNTFASSLEVMPTTITMASGSTTALLTVQNQGQEEVRMEVSVSAWNQKSNGEMVLTPTYDVVFFPELLSIPAGGSHNIRIGTVVPPGTIEKTYRLRLMELPNLAKNKGGFEVQVLVNQSIPIFLMPPDSPVTGRIEALSFTKGVLSFTVRNTGTRHFIVKTIRITGFDAAGREVFSQSNKGWYILAAGIRDYQLPVSKNDYRQSRRLLVEVETAERTFKNDFDLPSGGGY